MGIVLFRVDIPTVVICLCIVRVYFNGLVIIRHGLSKIALIVVDNAAVIIGLCKLGFISMALLKSEMA